ncbi:hypothetical protein AOR13_2801 [Alteromonas stellipolaris LMG 21856]|nr:hypothetical protein AOR13_2801 [Alteromonas stellipolaris LMG 21856]
MKLIRVEQCPMGIAQHFVYFCHPLVTRFTSNHLPASCLYSTG